MQLMEYKRRPEVKPALLYRSVSTAGTKIIPFYQDLILPKKNIQALS